MLLSSPANDILMHHHSTAINSTVASVNALQQQQATSAGLDWEQLKTVLSLKALGQASALGNSTNPLTAANMLLSPLGTETSAFLSVEKTAGDKIWDSIIHLNNQNLLPAKPLPLMTPRDQGSLQRCETTLEGETIACFVVGGEKRLCFPQVLSTVLRGFSLQDINSAVTKLNIHYSVCTEQQLNMFKIAGVLQLDAASCGLITKSDAERLCSYMLRRTPTSATASAASSSALVSSRCSANAKSSCANDACLGKRSKDAIPVAHECFGRCLGTFRPERYVSPTAECIECAECADWFSPDKFVRHSHRIRETRTCHWGFDSAHWRSYLHLQANVESDEKTRTDLSQMKEKFNSNNGHRVVRSDANEFGKRRFSETFSESDVTPADAAKRTRPDPLSAGNPATAASLFHVPSAAATLGSLGGSDSTLLWYYMLAASKLGYAPPMHGLGVSPLPGIVDPLMVAPALRSTFLSKKLVQPSPLVSPNVVLAQAEAIRKATAARLSDIQAEMIKEKEAQLLQELVKSAAAIATFDNSPPDCKPVAVALQQERTKDDQPPVSAASSAPSTTNSQSDTSSRQHSHSSHVREAPKKFLLHKIEEEQRADQQARQHSSESCSAATDTASPQSQADDSSTSSTDGHGKPDDDLSLDALLEKYVWEPAVLRTVRQKIAESQCVLETRIDNLSAENRILQQEIAYLRNSLVNLRPVPLSHSNSSTCLPKDTNLLQTALTEIHRAASASVLKV